MQKSMDSTRKIVLAGLMAALACLGTMIIKIPTPTNVGYIHIGDSIVYLCGVILGPLFGGVAAAIGSMLADIFLGYGQYAPATFVIKGLDAAVVGIVYMMITRLRSSSGAKSAGYIIGAFLGSSIMVLGYLAYEIFLYGFATAAGNVIANVIQAVGGLVIGYPIFLALGKVLPFAGSSTDR